MKRAIRHTVLVLFIGSVGCDSLPGGTSGDDSEATVTTPTPEETCAGTADDGVINVPEECASVSKAALVAESDGPGVIILIQPGTYAEYSFTLASEAHLEGASSEDRPVIQVPYGLTAKDATITRVVIQGVGTLQNNVAISDSDFDSAVHAESAELTVERSTIDEIVIESGAQGTVANSTVDWLVMSNGGAVVTDSILTDISFYPQDDTSEASADISDTEVDEVTMWDGAIVFSGSTVAQPIEVSTYYNSGDSVQISAVDSILNGINSVGTVSVDLLRVQMHCGTGETPLGFTATEDDDVVEITVRNSYITGYDSIFRLNGGDYDSIAGTQTVRLYNNVFAEGAFELSTPADCYYPVEFLDLTMENNIFVEVSFDMHVDPALSDINSPYNFYSKSSCDCLEGHARMDAGVCTTSASTEFDLTTATGSLQGDPLFISYYDAEPQHADIHLQSGSPAIDAGDSSSTWNDIDGSRNDMGAYGGPDANMEIDY